jgi:hypothetical protein
MLDALREYLSDVLRAYDAPTDPLDERELQAEAQAAFDRFDGTQGELSEVLGLDQSVISRALRNVGRRYAGPQSRIVSYVRGVPVERRSTYLGQQEKHRWIIGPREEPSSGA